MARAARPRRLMITPAPAVFAALGLDPATCGSPALESTLGCYARLLTDASRDVGRILTRDEWCYLADASNGTVWDDSWAPALQILAANAEDAQLLDSAGARWFGDVDSSPRAVKALLAKLAKLTDLQAEAVAAAIRWAWDNCDDLDFSTDPWWTTAFRAPRAIGSKK